jgi:hypothetical protein
MPSPKRLRPQIPRRYSSNQTYSSMIHVLERNASLEERRVKKNSAKPIALIALLS